MQANIINNPVGIDKAIQDTQLELANLPWMEQAYGRAYRFYENDGNGNQFIVPAEYKGRGEYTSVEFNDNLSALCFFEVGDSEPTEFGRQLKNNYETELAVVVWADLREIDQPEYDNYYFAERLIEEVKGVLTNSISLSQYSLNIESVVRNPEDVWSRYDHTMFQDQFSVAPYTVFKIEMIYNVLEEC